FFFFSSRRRHTRFSRDWSSDVCSSDLLRDAVDQQRPEVRVQIAEHGGLPGKGCLMQDVPGGKRLEVLQCGGKIGRVMGFECSSRSEERRVGKGVDLRAGLFVWKIRGRK